MGLTKKSRSMSRTVIYLFFHQTYSRTDFKLSLNLTKQPQTLPNELFVLLPGIG